MLTRSELAGFKSVDAHFSLESPALSLFDKLFNFQDWERAPKAKLPFIEVILAIVLLS